MAPSSTLAALFLLSLVPGWLFLRASEGARPPRPQSGLLELLEVIAVGLATTGASLALWVVFKPSAVLGASRAPETGSDLQDAMAVALVILGLACGIALVAAAVYRSRSKARYEVGVWQTVLNKRAVPKAHLQWVRVSLVDGGAVEGVLFAYTRGTGATHRDVALRSPIFEVSGGGKRRETDYDRLTVSGEQVVTVAVRHWPRTAPASPAERPRGAGTVTGSVTGEPT